MGRVVGSQNIVEEQGNVLTIYIVGDQTSKTVSAIKDEVFRGWDDRDKRSFLVDVSGVGYPHPSALAESRKLLKELPYKRIAIYGASAQVMYVVMNFIISKAVTDNSKVKVFRNEKDARQWLADSTRVAKKDLASKR